MKRWELLLFLALPGGALVAAGVWWWRRRATSAPAPAAELAPSYAGSSSSSPSYGEDDAVHVYHDERVQGLDPRLVQAIEEYERSGPLPITITEGYRTPERQAELKRQGKTNADPSQAPHCRKAAFDFAVVREVKNGAVRQVWLGEQAPEKYALVGQWFEERGLIWGGRWAFVGVFGELGDAPHIEVPNWRALPLA